MKKFVIFYHSTSGLNHVYADAESFEDASEIAYAFSRKFGYTIVGICTQNLLNTWYHE